MLRAHLVGDTNIQEGFITPKYITYPILLSNCHSRVSVWDEETIEKHVSDHSSCRNPCFCSLGHFLVVPEVLQLGWLKHHKKVGSPGKPGAS